MSDEADPAETADRLLEELARKHLEMAGLCGEYQEMLDAVRRRPWDHDLKKVVCALPGAKYHVSMTFAREQALKIEAELGKLKPLE
jgi:hypothetical protein